MNNLYCRHWSIRQDVLRAHLQREATIFNEGLQITEQGDDIIEQQGDIAVIPVYGVLRKDVPRIFTKYLGMVGTVQLRAAVQAAGNDPDVSKIVLRIDSPGGSVDGIAEFAEAVRAAAEKKPVIAQVDGEAASAAYHVASQATEIRLGRMDAVGSIGVFAVIDDSSRMFENQGIRTILVTTGEYKALGLDGAPVTENQIDEVKRVVSIFFDEFKGAVRKGRNMTAARVDAVADGRIFIGKQAVELGLADKIATFDQTIMELTGLKRKRQRRAQANRRLAAMSIDVVEKGGIAD